jgi:hypothetical protein
MGLVQVVRTWNFAHVRAASPALIQMRSARLFLGIRLCDLLEHKEGQRAEIALVTCRNRPKLCWTTEFWCKAKGAVEEGQAVFCAPRLELWDGGCVGMRGSQ